tara:strand:- start:6 stop:440 length:435 start_codon:yes stop_codon:yes gene_type:complete
MSKLKSYKGIIENEASQRIRLRTNKGLIGYKITKLAIIGAEPGQETVELVLKVYKTKQSTVDNAVNFGDSSLLAVAYLLDSSATTTGTYENIIFDNEIVNQDIFITAVDTSGSARATNYYMEMEQIKLDANEATMATLQNIRSL